LGLPAAVSALAPYNQLVISPLPIEQPGTLSPTGVNTVTLCVQPQENGVRITAGATVYLSINSGLFTTPPAPGGSAVVGSTALTAVPGAFTTVGSCSFQNIEDSGTVLDAVPITYTGPDPVPTSGRDVIVAADTPADSGANGICPTSGPCSSATYVFSPVTHYVFSTGPEIAPADSLPPGQVAFVTVTAEDVQGRPVPGAFLDLSLTSTAPHPGSATGYASWYHTITSTPVRFKASGYPSGVVRITYFPSQFGQTEDGTDTITAENHPGGTVVTTATYTYGTAGPYTPVTPFRVCDTRPVAPGIPVNECNTGTDTGPLGSGEVRDIVVDGRGGLPTAGVTAILVNVTAIAPTQATNIVLYQAGLSWGSPDYPGGSSLNPAAGSVVAALVEVEVSPAGEIDVRNAFGHANVTLDIEGYVAPVPQASAGLFHPTTSTRICDTRAAGHGIAANQCNVRGASPITAGSQLTFNVHSPGSPLPAAGVSAVVFNLTAIGASNPTVLTAYPGGAARPVASNLNVNTGGAVANRVIVPVSPSGTVSLWNSLGNVNVAVDVNGWFSSGPGVGAQLTSLPPYFQAFVCNTRLGNVPGAGCVHAGQVLNIPIAGVDGIPAMGDPAPPVAVMAEVTVSGASTPTYITAYPGPPSSTRPATSDISVQSAHPITTLVVIAVGADGSINLFNDLGVIGAPGTLNISVEVVGYYS
jgi:hypothetical protein